MSDGNLRDLLRKWVGDSPDRRDMVIDLLQERQDRRAEPMDRLHDRMDRRDRRRERISSRWDDDEEDGDAGICATGCGNEFQAAGRDEDGSRAGASGSSRRDAAGTAISSPEASGTRTEGSSLSFAGAFAVTSPGSIVRNGGVT